MFGLLIWDHIVLVCVQNCKNILHANTYFCRTTISLQLFFEDDLLSECWMKYIFSSGVKLLVKCIISHCVPGVWQVPFPSRRWKKISEETGIKFLTIKSCTFSICIYEWQKYLLLGFQFVPTLHSYLLAVLEVCTFYKPGSFCS